MDYKLIGEDEYADLLKDREKPLTPSQRKELRDIERTAIQIRVMADYVDPEEFDEIWKSLRNQQREVLNDEKKTLLEKIALLIPEKLGLKG